ncbi:hypothetical protein LV779_15635 [Streptomyces thinghirensis]|nr:hypothetical protein [Streptomyces thinghirensis]
MPSALVRAARLEHAAKPSLRGIAEGPGTPGRGRYCTRHLRDRPGGDVLRLPNTVFPFLADELDADWSLG